MQIKVERAALAAALTSAAKFVPHRSTIVALVTFLIETDAEHGLIQITATNLDATARIAVPAEIAQPGVVAVNAGLLTNLVKGSAGADASLATDGAIFVVKSGRTIGRIPTTAPEDFPQVFKPIDGVSFDLEASTLDRLVTAASFAVERGGSGRYYLTGTNWSAYEGLLQVTGTNGHVLSISGVPLPKGAETLGSVIVPIFPLPEFSGALRVDISGSAIRLSGIAGDHETVILSKLIDGDYPNFRRLILPPTATATVNRKALVDAIARCAPVFDGTRGAVDLIHDHSGTLIVQAIQSEGTEITDEISIEGAQFAVSLGGQLVAGTLASFQCESVTLSMTEIGCMVRIGDPDDSQRLACIMPMRSAVGHRIGPPKRAAA